MTLEELIRKLTALRGSSNTVDGSDVFVWSASPHQQDRTMTLDQLIEKLTALRDGSSATGSSGVLVYDSQNDEFHDVTNVEVDTDRDILIKVRFYD